MTLELRLPFMFLEEETSPIWDTWIWLMRERLTLGWRQAPSPSSLSPPGSFHVSGLWSHYPSLTLLVPPGEEPAPHQTLEEMQGVSSPLFVSLSSVHTLLDYAPPSPLFVWERHICHWPGSEGRECLNVCWGHLKTESTFWDFPSPGETGQGFLNDYSLSK